MPRRDVGAFLFDIVDACGLIRAYAEGVDRQRFLTDGKTRDAIERRLVVIGEAVSHLRRLDGAIAAELGPVEEIVAFRNILVHGYFSIDPNKIWEVVQTDVPG
jgi:uncharacterized protein with HEPN domain